MPPRRCSHERIRHKYSRSHVWRVESKLPENDTGFDGFPEAYFIRKQVSNRWVAEDARCDFHLMLQEFNLRREEGRQAMAEAILPE